MLDGLWVFRDVFFLSQAYNLSGLYGKDAQVQSNRIL